MGKKSRLKREKAVVASNAMHVARQRWEAEDREHAERLRDSSVVMFYGEAAADNYIRTLHTALGRNDCIYGVPAFCKAIECTEEQLPGILDSDFEQLNIQRVVRGEDPAPTWPLVLIRQAREFYSFELHACKPNSQIAGGTYREVAGRFGTSKSALERHKSHIAKALAKAKARTESAAEKNIVTTTAKQEAKTAASEVAHGATILDRLLDVHRVTKQILAEARAAKDSNLALRCLSRMEHQLELEAKLLGILKDAVPPPPPPFDLSRLSNEELSHLEVVMERATIRTRNDGEAREGERKQIIDAVSQHAE